MMEWHGLCPEESFDFRKVEVLPLDPSLTRQTKHHGADSLTLTPVFISVINTQVYYNILRLVLFTEQYGD